MSLSRPLMGLVAAATVLSLVAPPAGAAPSYDSKPATSGARWLSGQLTDGLVHNNQFKFDDVGLSIDVALGLRAAGKKADVVKTITKQVAKNLTSYIGFAPESYAGPTAKALALALAEGRDPRSFGGVDLVSALEARVSSTAPTTGRIEDASSYGDYANVIGQAYAAADLSVLKSPKAASALSFLLAQQCSKGYFRIDFTTDKSAADQSCNAAPRAERKPDTDATATAVIALGLVKGRKAKAAVKKAVAWLVDTQKRNGSFVGGSTTNTANTNSTGLAGWALASAGAALPAGRAAAWVRGLQVAVNPCANKLAKQAGAIAYDKSAYTAAQGSGIDKKSQDQWRRASAQALPVLQWAPRAVGEFRASGPASGRQGQRYRISLTGVAPGQRACVVEGASTHEFVTNSKSTSFAFVVASDPGLRTFRVWLDSRYRDLTVRVTG